MEIYYKKFETPNLLNPQPVSDKDGTAIENILQRGTDAYEQAEQMVGDVYDKSTEKVSETYEKAKNFCNDNPGKTIFIAFGIGVGLGLLGTSSHHRSRTNRIIEPVVNGLSDVAVAFFR